MPELGTYGSVRGARGNSRPYRESPTHAPSGQLWTHSVHLAHSSTSSARGGTSMRLCKVKVPNSSIKRIPWTHPSDVSYPHCGRGVTKVPIRPPPPIALYGDLERARQIARSWKPLDQLSPAVAEIVAKAIAEGIAEGRRHGLGMASPAEDVRSRA